MMRRIEQVEPRRDRWGRPHIDDEFYTRASTLGSVLDDKYGIQQWSNRMVGIGVAKTKHLTAGFATIDPSDKRSLDELVEKALDASGATAAREIGTAIHAATETVDAGDSLDGIPADIAADAHAYATAMSDAGFVPLVGELFVVNDELKVAGRLDRVASGKGGGNGIVDVKTSSNANAAKFAALSWAIQISVYANSVPYCADKGRMSWDDIGITAPNTMFGVVAHIVQGTGRCNLYKVDLERGYHYAKKAVEVREIRKDKNLVVAL